MTCARANFRAAGWKDVDELRTVVKRISNPCLVCWHLRGFKDVCPSTADWVERKSKIWGRRLLSWKTINQLGYFRDISHPALGNNPWVMSLIWTSEKMCSSDDKFCHRTMYFIPFQRLRFRPQISHNKHWPVWFLAGWRLQKAHDHNRCSVPHFLLLQKSKDCLCQSIEVQQ